MKIEKKVTHSNRTSEEINNYEDAVQRCIDVDFAAKILGCTNRYVRKLIENEKLQSTLYKFEHSTKLEHAIYLSEVVDMLRYDVTNAAKQELYSTIVKILYSSGIDGLHDVHYPNEYVYQ